MDIRDKNIDFDKLSSMFRARLKGESSIFEENDIYSNIVASPLRGTQYNKENSFLMPIEDVSFIAGRGALVTGRVERGQINIADTVEIVGICDEIKSTVVTAIKTSRKVLDKAVAGDEVGLILRGIKRNEVERGQVIAAPGSIRPHRKFMAGIHLFTKDEGGRHTPVFTNYRPQFYFRTTDVTGVVTLLDGHEMAMPGENMRMSVELIAPIAIEEGTHFNIREGGHAVGKGRVIEVIE